MILSKQMSRFISQLFGFAIILLVSSVFLPASAKGLSKGADTEMAIEGAREYRKEVHEIPMRDGVKLHTVFVIPAKAKSAPVILDRTPYSADRYTALSDRPKVSQVMLPFHARLVEAGFIVALQDIRGKHRSEGDYILNRPLSGPFNPTAVDHSTDAYDTIEWVTQNLKAATDRVGIMGLSYDGFTTLSALVEPHPKLKAAMPVGAMVDGWTGDDWFHNGAFRQKFLAYMYIQETTRNSSQPWPEPRYDSYTSWLEQVSAGQMARKYGLDKTDFYQNVEKHPAFDDFWKSQALNLILEERGVSVPLLLVHGQWDQEDIYGSTAVYKAVKDNPKTTAPISLVIGPWNHIGAAFLKGDKLGPLDFGSDTSEHFRSNIMVPFFKRNLMGTEESANTAGLVHAFESGSNRWNSFGDWPRACEVGCAHNSVDFFLRDGGVITKKPPVKVTSETSYVSDPAKPVTHRTRPIRALGAPDATWDNWLVDDQRFASSRSDVLTFISPPLEEPVRLAGQAIAHIMAKTTGSDADWVVKLIDVMPDPNSDRPELGGYQLPVAMDILRARYHADPAKPEPLTANEIIEYRLALPHVSHSFKAGHRIMIQIQSSWFPLYDRNPQTFVPNIFLAKEADYQSQIHTILHQKDAASRISLPIVPDALPQ